MKKKSFVKDWHLDTLAEVLLLISGSSAWNPAISWARSDPGLSLCLERMCRRKGLKWSYMFEHFGHFSTTLISPASRCTTLFEAPLTTLKACSRSDLRATSGPGTVSFSFKFITPVDSGNGVATFEFLAPKPVISGSGLSYVRMMSPGFARIRIFLSKQATRLKCRASNCGQCYQTFSSSLTRHNISPECLSLTTFFKSVFSG